VLGEELVRLLGLIEGADERDCESDETLFIGLTKDARCIVSVDSSINKS